MHQEIKFESLKKLEKIKYAFQIDQFDPLALKNLASSPEAQRYTEMIFLREVDDYINFGYLYYSRVQFLPGHQKTDFSRQNICSF